MVQIGSCLFSNVVKQSLVNLVKKGVAVQGSPNTIHHGNRRRQKSSSEGEILTNMISHAFKKFIGDHSLWQLKLLAQLCLSCHSFITPPSLILQHSLSLVLFSWPRHSAACNLIRPICW